MSNKGTHLSTISRYKIAQSKIKDRTELLKKINEYILKLTSDDFPSITSASLHASISEKALLALELRTEENSDLRILLDVIRDKQKEYLMKNGLSRKTDSKLSIMLLKANHGLKEEPTNLTQNNSFNISPEILAEAIQLSRSNKK